MIGGWAAIARFGGIGDNLIASAVLPGLSAKYGHVEVITQHPQHVVFENNPWIDKLAAYKPGDIPGGDSGVWQGWFASRAKEYDFFANLSHSCETLRALTMGQTQFYWSDEFRRKMCGHSYLETVADICGVPYTSLAPGFFPTDAEKAQAAETKARKGDRLIGWVLAGTRIDKIYPYAPMAVARLIREVGPVMLLGAPSQKEVMMAQTIEAHVRQQNGSIDGLRIAMSPSFENEVWPIRRILTMAQACDLVIGPDTGPMWGVAMCDMPKIMLLSHASPENITKYWRNTVTLHADPERVSCWPCHKLIDLPEHCRVNQDGNAAACISDISVERLMAAVAQVWRANDVRDGSGEAAGGVLSNSDGARQRSLGNGQARVKAGQDRPSHAAD